MPVSRKSTGMSGLIAAAMCNSTADSAPNDETSARRSPSVSIAAAMIACGSASRSSLFSRVTRGAVSPSYAMAGLPAVAFDINRLASIGGALIDVAEGARGLGPRSGRRSVRRLEGVEPAAGHEQRLFAQNIADRPHLALVAVALAQQSGRRVGAPVAELRDDQ